MATEIIVRNGIELKLDVNLIYDAIAELEDKKEEVGPDACQAVEESVKICLQCISGKEEYFGREGMVKANYDLLQQAKRIKRNRGIIMSSIGQVLSYRKTGMVIASVHGYLLSHAWTEFCKGLFTFYRVATGSIGGTISTLAALKDVMQDVKRFLPNGATWYDYLKYTALCKQPIIGETSDIVKAVVEQLSQDPSSVFYSLPSPADSNIAIAASPSSSTLLEGGMNIFSSVAKAAGDLVKQGFKTVYRYELTILDNQVEKFKKQQLIEIEYSTKDLKASVETIYNAKSVAQGTITSIIVILILMMIYIVYRTCVNAYFSTKDRERRRRISREIQEVLNGFNEVMMLEENPVEENPVEDNPVEDNEDVKEE